jgi:hypothetical protein
MDLELIPYIQKEMKLSNEEHQEQLEWLDSVLNVFVHEIVFVNVAYTIGSYEHLNVFEQH